MTPPLIFVFLKLKFKMAINVRSFHNYNVVIMYLLSYLIVKIRKVFFWSLSLILFCTFNIVIRQREGKTEDDTFINTTNYDIQNILNRILILSFDSEVL